MIAQGEGGDTGGMIGSGGEGDNGMSMDNSTMMNATLAYAQGEEGEDTGMTEGLGNDTGMTEGEDTGGMTEGQSEDNGGDEENKDNGN